MRYLIGSTLLILSGCSITPATHFKVQADENKIKSLINYSKQQTEYGHRVTIKEDKLDRESFIVNITDERSFNTIIGIQKINFIDSNHSKRRTNPLKIEAECRRKSFELKLNFRSSYSSNINGARTQVKIISDSGNEILISNINQRLKQNSELYKFLIEPENKGKAKIYLKNGEEYKTTIRPNSLLMFTLEGNRYCTL